MKRTDHAFGPTGYGRRTSGVGQSAKVALAAVAILALLAIARGEDEKRTVAKEALAQIKQAFPYTPAAIPKKEEKKDSDEQIVIMERVTVAESPRLRDLREKIAVQDEKLKAERFSAVKGGAILKKDVGRARIELGGWGAASRLNFLKISW